MTSYDAESDGPNFSPEHGVQLTDPWFLEYVGAPESSRLMSRSPEYWVHHMGAENALSAALQLQHDAGLVARFHGRSRRHHEDADSFADAITELFRVGYTQSLPELRQELISELKS